MTMITTIFHDETTNKALRGTEMILGGFEIRIRFVRILGDPGIRLAFHPHTGPGAQDWSGRTTSGSTISARRPCWT